jgi:hypothetical protein
MACKQGLFALLAVGALALTGIAGATSVRRSADGGSGTYTEVGTAITINVTNTGTTGWRYIVFGAPGGASFLDGSTSGTSTAPCVTGSFVAGPGELECGPYTPVPAGASATILAHVNEALSCGAPLRFNVNSTGVPPYPEANPVTYGGPPCITPRPSGAPGCETNAANLKKLYLKHFGKKRSSAKSPPSALQGQCTLPPRGPCLNKTGLLIDGGPNDETLDGTPLSDTMNGQGGNDSVNGKDDNDLLRGGPGRDTLNGNECDDVLFSAGNDHDAAWDGGSGNDVLNGSAVTMDGGPNDDYVVNGFPRRGTTGGGGGDDLVVVTGGEEGIVSGGGGKDTIDARNRSRDKIDCGPGSDTLYADQVDTFKNCEKVILK